jgi:hypothetical protein
VVLFDSEDENLRAFFIKSNGKIGGPVIPRPAILIIAERGRSSPRKT